MAASDAKPVIVKGVAYRLYFVVLDTAGARVTAITSPDSKVSKDGMQSNGVTPGASDCTNEAVYVILGRCYIDLTLTEITADHIGFSFTCTEGTFDIELYTAESGEIPVHIQSIANGVIAAATFAVGAFAAVWTVAERLLTAGTNIALAKGTGVTGFNDLDAAGVRSAVGLTNANLDAQLDAVPTAAELTTAINAVLAAIAALNNLSSSGASNALITALTTALAEGYRGTRAPGSVRDLLYEMRGQLGERSVVDTLVTLKKIDGTTPAKTFELDQVPSPTAITEAT